MSKSYADRLKRYSKWLHKKVVVNGSVDEMTFVGEVGTVICLWSGDDDEKVYPPLGVHFDKRFSHGHILEGNCPQGYGYYVHESMVYLVGDKEMGLEYIINQEVYKLTKGGG